jgi:hypothetical protein
MSLQQIGKIRRELLLGQLLDLMFKISPDAPDRPGVSLDGFGLKSFEPQVLQV